MHNSSNERTSLNKVVSASGFCSRREADKLIEAGRVTINNQPAKSGAKVGEQDSVEIDGEKIKSVKQQKRIYMALNKPVGITSTTDLKDKNNIIEFLNYPKRLFPVGRLDKDSDGLIFMTNDGDIVNKILRASNHHTKEYVVTVDKAIDDEFIRRMANGLPILNEVTKKCYVRMEGNKRFRIVLTQGLNRQIRRMCEYLGYEVKTLTRVAIMHVALGNLQPGKWRYLSQPEIEKMNELISSSTGAAPPKENRLHLVKPPTKKHVHLNESDHLVAGKQTLSRQLVKSKGPQKTKKGGPSKAHKKN